MCAVGEENSPLVSKCMDFCQALASQGEAFNFSLSIGSNFSFSLDTRSKEMKKGTRTKKPSPSTLRRNAKRRQDFLEKKQNSSAVKHIAEVAAVPVAPPCDMCDYKAASEKGLKTHKRMKHGPPRLTPPTATPSSPETLRGPGQMSALNTSPILLFNREENCHNCGGPFSPSHQCESVEAEEPTSPPQPQLDSEDDECDCKIMLESDRYCCKDTDCDHPDNCECKTKPCRCCCQPGK